jgi:ribosomal protein S27E
MKKSLMILLSLFIMPTFINGGKDKDKKQKNAQQTEEQQEHKTSYFESYCPYPDCARYITIIWHPHHTYRVTCRRCGRSIIVRTSQGGVGCATLERGDNYADPDYIPKG